MHQSSKMYESSSKHLLKRRIFKREKIYLAFCKLGVNIRKLTVETIMGVDDYGKNDMNKDT